MIIPATIPLLLTLSFAFTYQVRWFIHWFSKCGKSERERERLTEEFPLFKIFVWTRKIPSQKIICMSKWIGNLNVTYFRDFVLLFDDGFGGKIRLYWLQLFSLPAGEVAKNELMLMRSVKDIHWDWKLWETENFEDIMMNYT